MTHYWCLGMYYGKHGLYTPRLKRALERYVDRSLERQFPNGYTRSAVRFDSLAFLPGCFNGRYNGGVELMCEVTPQ